MTEKSHIIPIPAASGGDPLVVVKVERTGSSPLDVTISGSEGVAAFVAQIKQRDIAKLKHGNKFKGSDEEWRLVLSHFLLHQAVGDSSLLDGIEIVYQFEGEDIKIQIRRSVGRIKVILGEIILAKDEELEINMFEWAQIAAQANFSALNEVARLTTKFDDQRKTIDQLSDQLQDLLKTKESNEAIMLEQFKELLNEKKRKVRDQQRLLSSARVDKVLASNVRSSRDNAQPRKAEASRASKRKANGKKETTEPESESDEFEQMQVDEKNTEQQREAEEEMPEAITPDRTTDGETEDEDDMGTVPPSSVPQTKPKSAGSSKSSEPVTQPKQTQPPPPKRELPFHRPTTRSKDPPPPAANEDDTEDEEL